MTQSSPPACGGTSHLTAADRDTIALARKALGAEHGYDATSLAERCGRLEWHLQEMLRLAGRAAG